jgi:hypothetical protein
MRKVVGTWGAATGKPRPRAERARRVTGKAWPRAERSKHVTSGIWSGAAVARAGCAMF